MFLLSYLRVDCSHHTPLLHNMLCIYVYVSSYCIHSTVINSGTPRLSQYFNLQCNQFLQVHSVSFMAV